MTPLTDAEIARMYQAGAAYHAIPASTSRITRALNRYGIERRPVGTTATSGAWIAEVAAMSGGQDHPEPPRVYTGSVRWRQKRCQQLHGKEQAA